MNKKLIILALITSILSQFAFSQKIYEWRNTNRAGIYNESNLLKSGQNLVLKKFGNTKA
ncbi:MAG: hypothetical protein HC831_12505 [Chloroflexia bacterium]|nr:hypothetical protein [Chloroflexia bacterium]